MPGRMGNKNRTVQNLLVMKVDNQHNLLYIKGCVPGVDNQYVRVTDAVRKQWYSKCFPDINKVPIPTMMQSNNERESVAESEFTTDNDPFRRTKREKP